MKNKFIKVFLLSAMIAVVITQAISISAATYITDGKDFYLAFDYNQDGLIDIRDLVNIKKSIANGDTTPAKDYNCDGIVNAKDLIYAKYYLLGIDNSAWTEAF